MSYLPASADEMNTTGVVEVLQNPGGGLVVPKPSSFPFVPVVIGVGLLWYLTRKKR